MSSRLWGRHLLCGFLIGGGSILPGVSGGVLALLFGIYLPLMDVITNPIAGIRRHFKMLVPVGIGLAVGFFAFAKIISLALDGNTTIINWLFVGLVAGTLPAMAKEAGRDGHGFGAWLTLLLAGALIFASLRFAVTAPVAQAEMTWKWYALSGFILGIGVVVPGLSTSSILIALGMYKPLMQHLSDMHIPSLAMFVPFILLTMVFLARLVTWLFANHYRLVFHAIMGIVIASTLAIVPTEYAGLGEISLCALSAVGGFILAWFMAQKDPHAPPLATTISQRHNKNT